jgi:hypothetical protein
VTGLEGLRVWADSREAQARRNRKVRLTVEDSNSKIYHRTRRAGALARLAERSSAEFEGG